MFVNTDPLGGLSVRRKTLAIFGRLLIQVYQIKKSVRKLARKTGLLIDQNRTHWSGVSSTAIINEITNNVGLKSSNFPEKFDCASIWSTLEALGNAGQEEKPDIKALVSKTLKSERGAWMANLTSSMNSLFVKDESWSKFLIQIGA